MLMDDSNLDFNHALTSLVQWVPKSPILSRKVWLQCFGVPLHGWSVKFLRLLGER